jgi:hypothetical protein
MTVPFECAHQLAHGPEVCLTGCPAAGSAFLLARAGRPDDVPEADPRVVDVALLDMLHGWPNLGHDALVYAVQAQVCDMREALTVRGMAVRVISYDVRRGHAVPEPPGGRHRVYVGTGGPGHLDPRRNDGVDEGSQGITEDPAWEAPLFRLFDRIAADRAAALFGVCHTFGVMCRWLGIAEAVLRPASKGGKSAGIVENVLTGVAREHPWFSRFAGRLPDGRHFPVLDSRLYDLIPHRPLGRVAPLAYETLVSGEEGDALTMIEVGEPEPVPRLLGVNHHPEIVDRQRQLTLLRNKRARGEVTEAWYSERARTLEQPVENEPGDGLLHVTSSYTLFAPLRAWIYRAVQERADALGTPLDQGWQGDPLAGDRDGAGPQIL